MIDIIKKLAGAALGGAYGYLAAAAIGAALAGWGVYEIQGLRIDAIAAQRDMAARDRDNAEENVRLCAKSTERQNLAIAEAEERARLAALAMENANTAREAAEDRANDILREREPAGQDECTVARNAFDAELRAEREQLRKESQR